MRRHGALTLAVLLGATLGTCLQTTAQGRAPAGQAPGQPAVPPQSPDLAQQPPAGGESLPTEEKPPTPFPAEQRPLPPPAVLEHGKTMYLSMCSACHGADARGGQLGVNLLGSPVVLGDRDGERVAPIVKAGRPGTAMPPFQLPEPDIQAVIAYLHSLQAHGVQGAPPPGRPTTPSSPP